MHAHYCEECGDSWVHDQRDCDDVQELSCPDHFYAPRHTGAELPFERVRFSEDL